MEHQKQHATFNEKAHPYLSQITADRIAENIVSGKTVPGWYGYTLSEGCHPYTFALMTKNSHKSSWYIAARKANWKKINSI